MKTRLFLVLLLFGVIVPVAHSGEPKAPAVADKHLAYFVGSWDVVVKYKLGDGQEREGHSRCETQPILDGKFIRQEYQSKLMGQPLIIWQLLGYDSLQKKYVEFQLHAHGPNTHTTHGDGAFTDDGKVLTLHIDTLDAMTGKPAKLRTVATIQDDDHYTLEWFYAEPGGKEERKVALTHTRRK